MFASRIDRLPRLGLGLSTEFGASAEGIHPVRLREAHPGLFDFLEIGADVDRGFDPETDEWLARGWPTTYHFLDLNLEEPEDLDRHWLRATLDLAGRSRAAWLCGDAGLWHVGPRDRGHGTLLPPILCSESARSLAETVVSLREQSGLEVLPENPPAHVLVGDLHPLAYFAEVAERADCGLLLDLSHLAIVQQALGLSPTTLLDTFPVERVVELHVAGGRAFSAGSRMLVDDDHGPHVVDAVWALLDALIPRATALRAVVVECERNRPEEVLALFARVRDAVSAAPGWTAPPVAPPSVPLPIEVRDVDHRSLQRTLFRMMLDPTVVPDDPWLAALDPALVAADPGERRRKQLLGNVALEFVNTVQAAPPFLDGFPSSPEFHAAIEADRSLPLAFAAYAARVLPEGPWSALLALETAMAEVRRISNRNKGDLTLTPGTKVLDLPEGTVAIADARTAGLPSPPPGAGRETVVIVGKGPLGPNRELRIEVVPEAVADLLKSCPLDPERLAAFAARHEAAPKDVVALIDGLVADGLLGGY
jgi:uncharacterized protein (UPF0276 family)